MKRRIPEVGTCHYDCCTTTAAAPPSARPPRPRSARASSSTASRTASPSTPTEPPPDPSIGTRTTTEARRRAWRARAQAARSGARGGYAGGPVLLQTLETGIPANPPSSLFNYLLIVVYGGIVALPVLFLATLVLAFATWNPRTSTQRPGADQTDRGRASRDHEGLERKIDTLVQSGPCGFAEDKTRERKSAMKRHNEVISVSFKRKRHSKTGRLRPRLTRVCVCLSAHATTAQVEHWFDTRSTRNRHRADGDSTSVRC